MRYLRSVTMLLTSALLASCYSPPLSVDKTYPAVIRTSRSSGEVFRRLYVASQACYAGPNPRVTVDFSPSTQEGTLHYFFGLSTFAIEVAQVEVRSDVDGSVVLMRLKGETQSRFAQAVPAWLNGERTTCPY